jgi:hypothetical protein
MAMEAPSCDFNIKKSVFWQNVFFFFPSNDCPSNDGIISTRLEFIIIETHSSGPKNIFLLAHRALVMSRISDAALAYALTLAESNDDEDSPRSRPVPHMHGRVMRGRDNANRLDQGTMSSFLS